MNGYVSVLKTAYQAHMQKYMAHKALSRLSALLRMYAKWLMR